MRVVHRAVALAGSQGRRGRVEEPQTTLAVDMGCLDLRPRVEVAELLKSCPVSPGYRLRSSNSALTELWEWVEADLERLVNDQLKEGPIRVQGQQSEARIDRLEPDASYQPVEDFNR